MTKGAIYAISTLNPDYIFPMHANGKEYLYREFFDEFADEEFKKRIICMSKSGETWSN
jgi:hypothetical protein